MATGKDVEIEEELRLAYVATTRARDFLYVLWPLRYYHKSAGISDKHSYAQCSRFFTKAVMHTMEKVTEGPEKKPDEGPAPTDLRKNINDKMLDMWK